MNSVEGRLTRIETKIDEFKERFDRMDGRFDRMEGRLFWLLGLQVTALIAIISGLLGLALRR